MATKPQGSGADGSPRDGGGPPRGSRPQALQEVADAAGALAPQDLDTGAEPDTDGDPGGESASVGGDAELSRLVGSRLRLARREAGLSLRQLAGRCDLSIGFLSQVERGRSSLSLAALKVVATALEVDLRHFFDDGTAPPTSRRPVAFTLTRAQDRQITELVSGARTYRLLSDRAPDLVLEPMIVHIAPGGVPEERYGHAGEEFAYVLHGELVYTVDGIAHRLGPGDSVHLRSDTPHNLHNDTDEVTTVVSVVTPRLF